MSGRQRRPRNNRPVSHENLYTMNITRRLEFDAGHRIPNHQSQCRNLHGHRYAMEITLTGAIHDDPGDADDGMVMDFAEIKTLAKRHLIDLWDHAFIVGKQDRVVIEFLQSLPQHKTVILDRVPTAENMAEEAFRVLEPIYGACFGDRLRLSRIRLYETPNCWADAITSQTGASHK